MGSFKKFDTYGKEELSLCGDAFKNDFKEKRYNCLKDWTKEVCQCFADAAPDDVRVFDHSHDGEFIFDHCQMRFPKTKAIKNVDARWREALEEKGSCELLLAMESEWGNVVDVLEDAHKLAVVRAKVKILVFESKKTAVRGDVIDKVEKLRSSAKDTDPWLIIDVPRKLSDGIFAKVVSD